MNDFDEYVSFEMKATAPKVLPEYTYKTDKIVKGLKSRRVVGFRYYSRIAVVFCFLLVGATSAYASYDYLKDRFSDMNDNDIEEINDNIQNYNNDKDVYSRNLTASEEDRMRELRSQYEKGTYPEGRIQQFETIEEAAGNKFCYCYENSCIYIPDEELTDEQLLEIIELQNVRNYALMESRNAEEATSGPEESAVNEEVNTESDSSEEVSADDVICVNKKTAKKLALETAGFMIDAKSISHVYVYDNDDQNLWEVRIDIKGKDIYLDVLINDGETKPLYAGFFSKSGQDCCNDDEEFISLDEQAVKNGMDEVKPIAEYLAGDGCHIGYTYFVTKGNTLWNGSVSYIVFMPDDSCYEIVYDMSTDDKGIGCIRSSSSYDDFKEFVENQNVEMEGKRTWSLEE